MTDKPRSTKQEGVNAQFVMTAKARANAQKFKDRLARHDIKIRLGDVVNLLLEKTTLADFDRLTKNYVESNGAIEKLRKMHANGQITESQLNQLLENARRRMDEDSE